MTDDDVCPDCGRPYVKMTHHSEMTTDAHSIDRSGALPEVDDFCIIEGDRC
jgi:hypothetical protein